MERAEEGKAVPSSMTQCYENYIIVDVGANLTNKKYSRDLDSVIQRAKDAGVQKIMVTGASIRSSKEALRLVLDVGTKCVFPILFSFRYVLVRVFTHL